MTDYAGLGRRLYEAYRDGLPTAPPSEGRDLTLADAYRLQAAALAPRRETGATQVGYKLGFTNERIQQQFGIDEPASGRLLDDALVTGSTVATETLVDPQVEPEIGLLLERPLSGTVTPHEVLAATDAVVPVLEVVDSRVDGEPTAVDAVADNALTARLVPGTETTDPHEVDLGLEAVQLRVNGRLVETGTGADVLEHPARAVAWLAESVAETGDRVEAGMFVSTGSLTSAVPVESGDVVEARFGQLGSVIVALE